MFRCLPVIGVRCVVRLLVAVFLAAAVPARAADPVGIEAPPGFDVTLYADDELAHDIYSMAVDSLGRVVVSGSGYVRILVDADGDGRAESFKQYADGPKTGAQGLYFHGRDLLCSGDAGLIRYRDQNADDRADDSPDVFIRMKAGGEHDCHAIRKGPDGWWYVLCGNMTGVNKSFVKLSTSPIKDPTDGTVLRLSPDLTQGEVVAHGYRNAYDFDFSTGGDLFTFDSDEERSITLPWYEPTRVFLAAPGSHAGWFGHNFRRPPSYFDVPPTIAEFGRGSPTGVVCYRHTQFPEQYRGALFVLDWTYGRVFALPMNAAGNATAAEPIKFLSAIGQHGFAPTDADVGPDGSLYVCVGGRGTRGSVYRVRAADAPQAPARSIAALPPNEQLAACLDAPQPYDSWSRRNWESVAEKLGAEPFRNAALDKSNSPRQRSRAVEILVDKFDGLDETTATKLAAAESPIIRVRTAWALGRTRPEAPPARDVIARLVVDSDGVVQRTALEAILGAQTEWIDGLAEPVGRALASPDRYVRMAGSRVMTRMSQEAFMTASAAAINSGWGPAIPVAAAFSARSGGYQTYTVDIARRILAGDYPLELKLDAARLLQIGLGDVKPKDGTVAAVFDGYASKANLKPNEAKLLLVQVALAKWFPSGDAALDRELGRVIAMLAPPDPDLLTRVVDRITADSNPVDDIHWLIVAARIPARRSPEVRERIAEVLVNLDAKIHRLDLPQDSAWDERMGETFHALVERDAELPLALLKHGSFGRPAHVAFVPSLPPEKYHDAVDAFLRQIRTNPDYKFDAGVILLLSHSEEAEVSELVRSKFDDLSLRNSVLMALATDPQPGDRQKFVAGLDNTPMDILSECVKSLLLLDADPSPAEQVALVRVLRRMGDSQQEREVRDQTVEILRRNNGVSFDYVLGQEGLQTAAIQQWENFAREKFPDEFAKQSGDASADLKLVQEQLPHVDWSAGDSSRGEKLFATRACIQCHGSSRALGPDLHGAAQRFSREDLFTAIAAPSRDVSPRYQTTMIATTEGQVFTGLIVYESVDGLVLRNSTNQTFRIETKDIETRRVLNQSLMPAGLLKELGPADLADLYAYLRGMNAKTSVAETPAESRE
jgi:putative membrane-bound dehydrogenase-like protein